MDDNDALKYALESRKNAQAGVDKAQAGVDKAQEGVDRAEDLVTFYTSKLKTFIENQPNCTGEELLYKDLKQNCRDAREALDKAREALDKAREALDKAREALKEREAALKEREAALKEREAALNKAGEQLDKATELHGLSVKGDKTDEQEKKRLRKDLIEFRKQIGNASSFGSPTGKSSWTHHLKKKKKNIACHRNVTCVEPLPVTLLSQFFAEFSNDCETIDIDSNVCHFFVNLTFEMQKIQENENSRKEAFICLFEDYTKYTLESIVADGSTTDGSLVLDGYMYCNLEVKNEKGSTEDDPYMQNIAYYLKKLKIPNDGQPVVQQPCVLLELNGCNFGVCGIVNCPGLVVCDPLSPTYYLTKLAGSELVTKLLRLFVSLKKLLDKLHAYYVNKELNEESHLPYSRLVEIDSRTVTLSFKYRIDRLTFLGLLEDEQEVIIKFSENYGKEVHMYCYEHGFSPKLLVVTPVLPYLRLIVMEKANVRDLEISDVNLLKSQGNLFLQRLQDKGYVHGDLRANNIKINENENKIVVLDFDWAGLHGKDVYPPFMNPSLDWPEGASTGKPLLHAHDQEWMQRLLDDYE